MASIGQKMADAIIVVIGRSLSCLLVCFVVACGVRYYLPKVRYYLPKVRYFFRVFNNQSIINAIYIASFDGSQRGRYPIKLLSRKHGPHQQEQRKRAIQFVKGGTTSRGCTLTVKFDYFEHFLLLTNYLGEIATDPQVSILCSGRAI